jgi:hypothetical protein
MNTAWMMGLALGAVLVSGAATAQDAPGKWNWEHPDIPAPAATTPAPPACDKPGPDGKPPADCAAPQPTSDTGLEDSLSPPTPIVPSGGNKAKKLR